MYPIIINNIQKYTRLVFKHRQACKKRTITILHYIINSNLKGSSNILRELSEA